MKTWPNVELSPYLRRALGRLDTCIHDQQRLDVLAEEVARGEADRQRVADINDLRQRYINLASAIYRERKTL